MSEPTRRRVFMLSALLAALASLAPAGTPTPSFRVNWAEGVKRAPWPVTAGVPFGRGALATARRVGLVDAAGRTVPAQFRVLQRWYPDRSVRWLSADFIADPDVKEYRVIASSSARPSAPGVKVVRNGDFITVDTGALKAEVPLRGGCGVFSRVWVGDRLVCRNSASDGQYLVDQKGVSYRASQAAGSYRVSVEREGPIHVVVRLDGEYEARTGKRTCRYTARLHFYRGQPRIRLQNTFIFTENSEALQIRDLGVRVSLTNRPTRAEFRVDALPKTTTRSLAFDGVRSASLFQRVHHHLGQPASDGGLIVTRGGKAQQAHKTRRCGNRVTLTSGGRGVTVVLKHLWEEFPKELEVRGSVVDAHFWSGRGGKLLDFRLPAILDFWGKKNQALWKKQRLTLTRWLKRGRYKTNAKGVARTHEVLYVFHPASERGAADGLFNRPPLACPDPAWTAVTGVVGPLSPRDPARFPRYEEVLDLFVPQFERLVDEWGDYGWWEHGVGPHLVYHYIAHKAVGMPKRYTGGCEYWYSRALWLAYLRSRDRRYFALAAPRARHFMDVVICHEESDTRLKGDFYWTPGETLSHWGGQKHSPMTRTATAGVHAQFGWTVDMLLQYYYLTGDDRAWDVVQEYAGVYRRLFDNNPKWVEETLRAANIMWSRKVFATLDELSILYEATGDPAFAAHARKLAKAILLPDSPGGIHLEPQFKGGKTVYPKPYALYYKTACVWRYWQATGDPLGRETLRRMTKYCYETAGWHARYVGLRYLYGRQLGAPESYTAAAIHGNAVRVKWLFNLWPPNSTYKLGTKGMTLTYASELLSMNGLMVMLRGMARPPAPFPVLTRYPESPRATLLVRPDAGRQARMEVFITEPEMRVTPGGARVTSRRHDKASFHEITFPATAAPATYRVEIPAMARLHVLTATNAKVMLAAPKGLPMDRESDGAAWYFRTRVGTKAFRVQASDPGFLTLVSPTGRKATFTARKGGAKRTVTLRPGEVGGVWAMRARDQTFVRLRGVVPLFAFRDKANLFSVGAEWRSAEDAEGDGGGGRFAGGVTGKGLRLGPGEFVAIPVGAKVNATARERFNMAEGTVEFWMKPDWPYFLSPAGARRTLLYAEDDKGSPALNVYYSRLKKSGGTMAYDIRGALSDGKTAVSSWGRKHARWMGDEWVHIAIQWRATGKGTPELFYYVNGRLDHNKAHRNRWRQFAGFRAAFPGKEFRIGGGAPRAESLDAVIDELRVSAVRRYRGDGFTPAKTWPPDKDTLVLLRFESNLKGVGGKSRGPFTAQVRKAKPEAKRRRR